MLTKLLWVSFCVPYDKAPHAGGQTFNFYFKNIFRDTRFDIKLIAFGEKEEKEQFERNYNIEHYIFTYEELPNKLLKFEEIRHRTLLLNKYASVVPKCMANKVLSKICQLKEQNYYPDIVILEWTQMLMLAEEIKCIYPHSKIVASEHDVTFIGYERKAKFCRGIKKITWQVRYRKEKLVEINNLKKCDLILPHNYDNKNILLNEKIPESRIQWMIPYYHDMSSYNRKPNYRDILFFGAMSRSENSLSAKWFIENVMPRLMDLELRFVILGNNPPDELKTLESERIHITGYVDSISSYFQEAMCFVAPLVLGAGIKVKVLEALSSGIPVLANDIAIEGIPAEDGKEFFHCVQPEDYEVVIRNIYNGKIDTENLCQNAKDFIYTHFSLKQSLEDYKNRLLELGEL